MPDYTDLKRRLLTFGHFAAERAEAAAAIAALEAEVGRLRAELGEDTVGVADEAGMRAQMGRAARAQDRAALADQTVKE